MDIPVDIQIPPEVWCFGYVLGVQSTFSEGFLDVFGEITYGMNMKPENLLNMDDNLLGATCIVDDITYENEKQHQKEISLSFFW